MIPVLAALAALLVSCAPTASPQQTSLSEASELVAKESNLQILDVRRPEEYRAGHLKGATRITWGEPDFEKRVLARVDRDQPVLVYCRSGRRSTAATQAMQELGYQQLHNLEGGITAWQKAGKEVVR